MRAINRTLAVLLLASGVWGQDGIQAFKEGRYSDAVQRLKTASDPTSIAFLALAQAALGDCTAALPALVSVSPSDLATYRLARLGAVNCYSAAGEMTKAFALIDELESKFPSDADVLYLSAKLHMKAFNNATLAMFQRAPSSYRVHELSAEIFEVEDRLSDAIAEYRKAIQANPNAVDLHFRLGRAILLQSHDPKSLDDAAAEFLKELKLSPEDSACEFQLGQIAQVKAQTSEAARHFERAIRLSPNFAQALIALAKIRTEEKQYWQAIDLLRRAISIQPENETAHYALLTAYRNSGQMDKAGAEKAMLDRLHKPPEGEFTDFLNRLGEKPPRQ